LQIDQPTFLKNNQVLTKAEWSTTLDQALLHWDQTCTWKISSMLHTGHLLRCFILVETWMVLGITVLIRCLGRT
jgi:hypothetical protein